MDSPGGFSAGWTSTAAKWTSPRGRELMNHLAALFGLSGMYWGLGNWFQALMLSLPLRQTGRAMRSMRSSNNGCIRHVILDASVSNCMTQG